MSGLRDRGAGFSHSNVQPGQGEAGMLPTIDGEGKRVGVGPSGVSMFSKKSGSHTTGTEDSLISGAELNAGQGQFPRKADKI